MVFRGDHGGTKGSHVFERPPPSLWRFHRNVSTTAGEVVHGSTFLVVSSCRDVPVGCLLLCDVVIAKEVRFYRQSGPRSLAQEDREEGSRTALREKPIESTPTENLEASDKPKTKVQKKAHFPKSWMYSEWPYSSL